MLVDTDRKKILLAILGLAVVVRIVAFGIAEREIGIPAFVTGDAVGYVEMATHLERGEGFATMKNGLLVPEVFRTPGFPLLIAPFMNVSQGIAIYGVLLSIIAGILLPLCTYQIAKRVVSHRAALVAALLIALEPHAVFYSFLLQTEMSFMLFAFGGVLASIVAYERSSYRYASLAGLLLGYAVFIRPGYLSVFCVLLLGVIAALAYAKDQGYRRVIVVFCLTFAVLAPWYIRNHGVTGVYALSGAGWRNVYTDYLASVRSIKNDTPFHVEKRKLKDEAMPRFGLTPEQVSDPANAKVLRDAALPELWANKTTVIRLESVLLLTFFTSDGYYYDFRNLGYIADSGVPNISPTHEILTKGLSAIPAITMQLSRQMFIPLWGRVSTVVVLCFSVAGFFLIRHKLRYVFVMAILLCAVASTAIGFGVDARMRVPVEPLFFIFASAAFVWLYDRIRLYYAR